MATFQFNLVSPEKLLFAGQVNQVDVPGSEGDFGVLAGHAPLMATLRPAGVVTVYVGNRIQRFDVNGGFADMNLQTLTILANEASSRD